MGVSFRAGVKTTKEVLTENAQKVGVREAAAAGRTSVALLGSASAFGRKRDIEMSQRSTEGRDACQLVCSRGRLAPSGRRG